MDIKLSCTANMVPGESLTEKAHLLRKLGYNGMAIFVDAPDWKDELLDEIQHLEERTGVKPCEFVLTAGYYGHLMDRDPAVRAEAMKAYKASIEISNKIGAITDPTWPETFWTPRDMTSHEYMTKIGPNHDGASFGLIGADFITFNAMLRIPVDMSNIPEQDVFRPTMWQRFGGDDYRACAFLGPIYA